MWDAAGNWIGLSAYINDAPWWAHVGIALVVLGLIYGLMAGSILGLLRYSSRL